MPGPELEQPQVSVLRAWDRSRLPAVPRWVGMTALVVVLLGTGGWLISQQFTSSTAPRQKSVLNSTSSYAKFKDPAGAFEGSYPPSWKRAAVSRPGDVLLATGPNGASFQVAKTSITAPVNATNLAAAKKLTDRVVRSGPQVKLLTTRFHQPAQVSIGGLPGYLYLYTFVDPTTGETGAHAHYFVFEGKTMITLVFQALPSTNFRTLAPLFDRIASTFRAIPG